MNSMLLISRRDARNALITGLTTGLIAWGILSYLGRGLPSDIPTASLAVIIPLLWLAGIQLGLTLSRWFPPMKQFGRFAAIGFTNAAVDFGILYLLIAYSGVATGIVYSVFKALSFSVATVHSYLWNKYWAFDAARSGGGSGEAGRFAAVALSAILVNVAVASFIVAIAPAGSDPKVWAGLGAIAGSASALIFSFIGFRAFVFRRKA
jgi:putative flippase GtrA